MTDGVSLRNRQVVTWGRGVRARCHWLVAGLLLVCLPVGSAQANYGGGAGSPEDPYQILAAEHLNAIGASKEDWDKHFILLDLNDLETEFHVIGTSDVDAFRGVFDGNGKTISNFSLATGNNARGLFGVVDDPNALIEDLGLINPQVDGGTASAIGSLVGLLRIRKVTHCYAQGGSVSGASNIGGLIGFVEGAIIPNAVENCFAFVQVTGSGFNTGGLVGFNEGDISNSYAAGAVTGNDKVGGLVGNNIVSITRCYSVGAVNGTTEVGGLLGRNTGVGRSPIAFGTPKPAHKRPCAGSRALAAAVVTTETARAPLHCRIKAPSQMPVGTSYRRPPMGPRIFGRFARARAIRNSPGNFWQGILISASLGWNWPISPLFRHSLAARIVRKPTINA